MGGSRTEIFYNYSPSYASVLFRGPPDVMFKAGGNICFPVSKPEQVGIEEAQHQGKRRSQCAPLCSMPSRGGADVPVHRGKITMPVNAAGLTGRGWAPVGPW